MKKFLTNIAKNAGQKLNFHFRNLGKKDVSLKSKHEVVTVADKISERYILSELKKNFPDYGILSEEKGGKKTSGYLWVVDPLDGTTNFSIGNPIYAVSIALFKDREPILGSIYLPYLDEIYWTEKGKGVYRGNKKIRVNKESRVKDSILTFCHGYGDAAHKRAVKIYSMLKIRARDYRQFGSAAFECVEVARGDTSALMINNVKAWDVGVGALMIREAGGRVTDFKDKEWNLDSKDFLASNGRVHQVILKVIKDL